MTKRCSQLTAFILIVASMTTSLTSADSPVEGKLDAFLGEPELNIQPVFKGGRFPNVVVTMKGTILATWGRPHIRAKRSEDGGKTWDDDITIAKSGIHGGGTTVDETTGDILAFVEEKHPPAPLTVYRSKDDGKAWQADPVTIHPDSKGRMPSMHMNEHGITLRHGEHKGRLIRPSRFYGKGNRPESIWPTHFTNAMYSDDGGKTWQTGEPFPENGTGEACVAELSNGRIYYNSRRHWAPEDKSPLRRWTALSDDGGRTWKGGAICEVLPDGPQDTNYGCMGGLVRLPIKGKDILIYSNCDSPKGRHHGTVWASFDGGKTWPLKRLVHEGGFAYSSLTAGRPGTPSEGSIYLHFESGGSKMARFNLSWVLAGEATGDGTVPDEPSEQRALESETTTIQGTWRCVDLATDGAKAPKEIIAKLRLVFKDHTLTFEPGEPDFMNYRFKLDPTTNPASFEMTHVGGSKNGKTRSGIYSLKRDRLTICFGMGKNRPKEFTAMLGSGQVMYTLERSMP